MASHASAGTAVGIAHWLEGPGPHVQRDTGAPHPARFQGCDQLAIEMQARGRCRYGARIAGKNALVAFAILGRDRALDIGRQRHRPVGLEEFQRGTGRAHLPQVLLLTQNLHRPAGGGDFKPGPDRLAGAQLHQCRAIGEDAFEKDLDAATGGLVAHHPRRDHTRVVEDQQVARLEQVREIPDGAVFHTAVRVQDQQPARGAFGEWRLRDQFGRQVIGKVR
jgi:hypothetical protein